SPATFDFDTTTYQPQYHWLGFHARRLVFDFLAETLADNTRSLDVFAYDLDEPDVIKQLGQLGSRLRVYLDNSASHVKAGAREPKAHAWLADRGAEIKVGHFQRFSHDKVLLQKRGDTALTVLSGYANCSGGGQLLDAIKALPTRSELYAFGTTQRTDGSLHVEKSGDPADGTFIPFSYLSKHVPAPFKQEWSGGAGQVIHHKFVVTDFNG